MLAQSFCGRDQYDRIEGEAVGRTFVKSVPDRLVRLNGWRAGGEILKVPRGFGRDWCLVGVFKPGLW
jgi:hypothetical protein